MAGSGCSGSKGFRFVGLCICHTLASVRFAGLCQPPSPLVTAYLRGATFRERSGTVPSTQSLGDCTWSPSRLRITAPRGSGTSACSVSAIAETPARKGRILADITSEDPVGMMGGSCTNLD